MEGELERAEERAETGETKVTHVKLFVEKLKKASGCFVANLDKNKHTFCSIYYPKGFILTF